MKLHLSTLLLNYATTLTFAVSEPKQATPFVFHTAWVIAYESESMPRRLIESESK